MDKEIGYELIDIEVSEYRRYDEAKEVVKGERIPQVSKKIAPDVDQK